MEIFKNIVLVLGGSRLSISKEKKYPRYENFMHLNTNIYIKKITGFVSMNKISDYELEKK